MLKIKLLEIGLVKSSSELGSRARQVKIEQIYKIEMFYKPKVEQPTVQLR